jgi:Ca-activated chloride channel family protein
MPSRFLHWSALALIVSSATMSARAGEQRSAFRAGVELVSLSVTVTDSRGRYVSDLITPDFTVLEDGRPQDLVFFSPATTALAVSLLIDSSASMEHQLPLTQKAASEFVARLRHGDTAQIVDFNSRVQVLQDFTSERQALEQAIWSIEAGGSTSLYNAIYIALRQLDTLPTPPSGQVRRKVVVVLSDGQDTSSLVNFDELLDIVKRSHVVLYPIGLGFTAPRPSQVRSDTEFELRRLAQETGGRLLLAKDAAGLSNVYNQVADELTSQYVLGYLSSNVQRGDGWRSISVPVGRPNLQVRTRTGYHVDTQGARLDR